MTNNKIIFWASDYSSKSGEGKLAKLFISKLKIYKKNTKIIPIKSLFTKKKQQLKKGIIYYSAAQICRTYIWNYLFVVFFFEGLQAVLFKLLPTMEFYSLFISTTHDYSRTNNWKCFKRY